MTESTKKGTATKKGTVPFNSKWYAKGLRFSCLGCGRCCCGPEEGYIWANDDEIKFIADYLKIDAETVKNEYTKKIGLGRSIIEEQKYNDCIFLKNRKQCQIYSVRPNQCRTWPFWDSNLENKESWSYAGNKCPGINKGKLYSFDEIEKIRKQKSWY